MPKTKKKKIRIILLAAFICLFFVGATFVFFNHKKIEKNLSVEFTLNHFSPRGASGGTMIPASCESGYSGHECCVTSWSPSTSSYYMGVYFTQTSNCGSTRTVEGTAASPPTPVSLSVAQSNYCIAGPGATFSWAISDPQSGDTQSAYYVQVATNAGFSGPGTVISTGKISSASTAYATLQGVLSYDQKYYWQVMIWDNHNTASSWVSGPSFTTPKHPYPTVDFSWGPINPSANEDTQFADQSTVYGGSSKSAWSWVFQDGSPTSSTQQNPMIKFLAAGAKQVVLQVTDSDGYACSRTKSVGARLALPNWKEIAP